MIDRLCHSSVNDSFKSLGLSIKHDDEQHCGNIKDEMEWSINRGDWLREGGLTKSPPDPLFRALSQSRSADNASR